MDHGGGDGRVVMIVRAASPRTNASNGAGNGGNGSAPDLLGLNMAAMEADWRQQQFQRQRMQLLSMAIFLCFMVLFFDNRAGADAQQRRNRLENGGSPSANAGGYNRYALPREPLNDSERIAKVQALGHLLEAQPGYRRDEPPLNVSGIYSGAWRCV